ncbi:MAG TPA: sigma-54 dependent transcriptional regulator [Ignavibacteria bacterium]|nr:sigma-54 dependent transcriptional regulator [Ignavibacteria bacterium]HMR41070.1 sigma-54 dependent transcriptional regulator [Ignavibacteria bacterium]
MPENIKIIAVDDEPNSTKLVAKVLARKGYTVEQMNDSKAALEMIEKGNYDIIISDLQMPVVTGADILNAKPADSLFIMITGYGSVDSAVESMKNGAFDYISKPFHLEELSVKIDKAVERIRLTKKLNEFKFQLDENYSFSGITGTSKKMQAVFELIRNVARTKVNVLVEGKSGTGKELAARAIHKNSDRKNNPFVAINCSAIPESLLESELFGHTKGAFTGASDFQKGVFEQAHGGTLFLDEIAEMPFNLQSKLLRVIETWEVKAIGSDKVKKVDVRLVSATNQNIQELIEEKKFREDLYYRISTITISLPSLNEKREDIPLIANTILRKLSAKLDRELSINESGLDLLIKNDWKGNVRELENVLERAAISSTSDVLDSKNFKFLNFKNNTAGSTFNNLNGMEKLADIEISYIKKVLEENNWNKLKASQILGIDRKTLYKKIREYNLE